MLAVGEVSLDVWSTIICYHLDLLSPRSVITSTAVIKGKYKCEPQLLS